ncbi:MAG: Phosphoserine phosphatase (EC [uncultured Thiotrichaceae bacterium]|uniref:Phosphoserine phosphatase (EC) n=1 Tax=uncultured Thiotrichaceae bacterium TaxID=298394 RepID=A0A6S6T3T8_9GAMM|nr:MAG: Phosphoserine phosphatase (EC [uncultured Thiotrichaceae bacterium]
MTLAIFDLDNTLLSGDSDYSWGQFLVNKGIVDKQDYAEANEKFYKQYALGKLDIHAFSAFAFKALSENTDETLAAWHNEFMQESILPIMSTKGIDLVNEHRELGHTLLVITATNSFITAPIVEHFGIPHLLATDPKRENGKYTLEIAGTPCFQEGKVIRLNAWIAKNNESMEGSYFYSDSHNDLPLLKMVDHPVAVDPDDTLKIYAEENEWQIMSLRNP